ncbi:MAG: hypothetical protein CMP20_01875 [Rickettsiales bacterium]|nr:hypothetical protein [Rickettsiales bacterium]
MSNVSVYIIVIHDQPVHVSQEQCTTDHDDVQAHYTAYFVSPEEADRFVATEPSKHYQATNGPPIDLNGNGVFVVLHKSLEQRVDEIKASFGVSDRPHVIATSDSIKVVTSVDALMEETDAIFTDWIERSGVLNSLVYSSSESE